MSQQTIDIPSILYDDYYRDDQTPSELISSHWKDFYKKVEVESGGGQIVSLKGFGFGDLQYNSILTRVFSWFTILSYFFILPNRFGVLRFLKVAMNLARGMELTFSYDCFRQLCAGLLIHQKALGKKKLRIINIGDGYGFLSMLLKEFFPDAQIYFIDLGKTLLFQAHYGLKVYPAQKHYLVSRDSFKNEEAKDADFIYCPAEHLSLLNTVSFDLAINIASMQEMNNETIAYYFSFLREHLVEENLFYCCNREEKKMPGGEIARFMDYPWDKNDQFLVDGFCCWYKYMLAFRKTKNGPKIFNTRVPFVNYFDGDVMHRLTVMQTSR